MSMLLERVLQKLGVDTSDLVLVQPSCGEEAFIAMEKLITSSADSVAALVPRAELEGDVGTPQVPEWLHAILLLWMGMHASDTCMALSLRDL